MTKKELDNLWELYREFCSSINATSVYAPDFLAWIDRYKFEQETKEQCVCGKEWKHTGDHNEPQMG